MNINDKKKGKNYANYSSKRVRTTRFGKKKITEFKNQHFNVTTNCATRKASELSLELLTPEIKNLIGGVDGVQTIENLIINNVSGVSQGYSQYKYGFGGATKNNVIYPSMDPSIFELKYPNSDIQGRVTTY